MADRKYTALPGGVTLKAASWNWGFSIEYLGTLDALIEVGAYTDPMRANHEKYHRGSTRHKLDEFGQRFTLHSARTKADPLRMRLSRSVPREIAAEVAGMRELFPEGIPGPLADVEERCETRPPREQTREEKMSVVASMLNTIGGYLAADLCTPESQSRIGAHISGIMAEFDRRPATGRPGHLWLVVDNTRSAAEVDRG